MNNTKNSPIMGEMPKSNSECENMESPLFITHSEAGALFNAIGYCCTSIKAMQCVVQEPAVAFLMDDEMSIYSDLRIKLFTFLNQT